jgi:hypothetical protein
MILNKGAIYIIRLYKMWISPLLSYTVSCRFHPTCSDYAMLCFENYEFTNALSKTVKRLGRCNPHNLDTCIDYPIEHSGIGTQVAPYDGIFNRSFHEKH